VGFGSKPGVGYITQGKLHKYFESKSS